jgi:hypothetical protein
MNINSEKQAVRKFIISFALIAVIINFIVISSCIVFFNDFNPWLVTNLSTAAAFILALIREFFF